MKRIAFWMWILFLLTLSPAQSATSLHPLLQSWLKAIGGSEKVSAIRTYTIRSEVETSGLKGIAVETGDSAGNHRTDLNLSDVYKNVTVFNAAEKKGWMLDQNTRAQDLEGRDLQIEISGAYLASWAPFFEGRLPAVIHEAGPDALQFAPEGGQPFTLYFDPKTGLPEHMEQPDKDRKRLTYFSDWRPVDGVLIPFQQRQTAGDPKYDVLIKVQEARFNIQPEADAFAKPKEAGPDYRFDSGSSAELDFELNSNHIFVQASVNDSAPLWFLLDTGADATVINLRKAKEFGFKLEGSMEGRGSGEGTTEVSFIKDASFRLKGVQLMHQIAATIDLSALEAYEGHEFDGILGYDFISRFVVQIDYAGRKVRLFEPQTFSYSGSGKAVPILMEGNIPTIHASVVQSGKVAEGKFDIDTGSRASLTMNRPFQEQNHLSETKTIEALWGMGVGGRSKAVIGRVEAFTPGAYLLKDVLTSFSQDTKGGFADPNLAGNIGGEILRRFTVTFDYSRKVMILEPNADYVRPFRFDMSGLNLSYESHEFKALRVSGVTAGSPAAAAGIQEGDVLEKVDGKPVSELTLEAIRQAFKEEGAVRKVTLSRNGKVFEVELALKPLI